MRTPEKWMRYVLLTTLLLAGLPVEAGARGDYLIKNGENLLRTCSTAIVAIQQAGTPGADVAVKGAPCLNYLAATNDYLSGNQRTDLRVCLPRNGSLDQSARVVLKYLNNHPEELHKPAPVLVTAAYAEAFPCEE